MNATQLFSCDSSGAAKTSPPGAVGPATLGPAPAAGGHGSFVAPVVAPASSSGGDTKSGPAGCVLLQGWMLMALAVSAFVPKNSRILWYLRTHFARNKDTKCVRQQYC